MSSSSFSTGIRVAASGSVSYTASAGTYGPCAAATNKVRVLCTTDAYVTFDGSTPSSSNGVYIVAKTAEAFLVTPGAASIKAVQVASGGSLFVAEAA
jgi:Chitobiase/beta-hexosaminidase C-terminal domain